LGGYESVHPLLRLSIDRIDPRIEDDHVENYRVTLRICNYAMNDFVDSDNALERWRQNLVNTYGQNGVKRYPDLIFSTLQPSLAATVQDDDDDDNDDDEDVADVVKIIRKVYLAMHSA